MHQRCSKNEPTSYSKFMYGLKLAGGSCQQKDAFSEDGNRVDPAGFAALAELAKSKLA